MRTKLRKVVEVYKIEGFFAVLSAIGHHVGWLLPPDEHRYVGLVITPVVGMLHGEIILKRFDGSYVNIRIFGTHPTGGRMYHSPTFKFAQRKRRIKRVKRQYFGHPDVPLSAGDVCLEVGAYTGMPTGVAADLCNHVIAVEPSPRNFRYLERNIRRSDVSIHNVCFWNKTGTFDFKFGTSSADDGFMRPDTPETGRTRISAYTIHDFLLQIGHDDIDFLKVEAEGAEPEVLEGLRNTEIGKVVVLCSAERDGRSPVEEVSNILADYEYRIIDKNMRKLTHCLQ